MTTVKIETKSGAISRLMSLIGAQGKRQVNSVAAVSVRALTQKHLRKYAFSHHNSSARLGAPQTGHLEKGCAAITSYATGDGGYVQIPIPGITRVFGAVTITPKRARSLTIPLNRASYGRTASEVRQLGWKLFSAKGVLFGDKGDGAAVPLYALKKKVVIPQDKTMLPTEGEMADAAEKGIAHELKRVLQGG